MKELLLLCGAKGWLRRVSPLRVRSYHQHEPSNSLIVYCAVARHDGVNSWTEAGEVIAGSL